MDDAELREQYYDKALPQVGDIEPFVELADRVDQLSKEGRINDIRRTLVIFSAARDAAIRIDTMHTAWARALHGVNSGDDLTLIREYIKSEFDAAQKELVERHKSDLGRRKIPIEKAEVETSSEDIDFEYDSDQAKEKSDE